MMQKSVFFSATLLSISSIGLAMALVSNRPASVQVPDPLSADQLIPEDFAEFLKIFPPKKLPYALTEKDFRQQVAHANGKDALKWGDSLKEGEIINMRSGKKSQSRLISEFVKEDGYFDLFQRMPSYHYPVAVAKSVDFYVTIYGVTTGFNPNRLFASYYVAVFDKSGKRISNHQIGSFSTGHVGTFVIDRKLNAVCSNYQIKWEKDYKEHGIQDNSIVAFEFVDSKAIDLMKPDIRGIYLPKLRYPLPDSAQSGTPL